MIVVGDSRPYHRSSRTDEILSFLPGWMKMKEPDSVGYQLINALVGINIGTLFDVVDYMGRSLHYSTSNTTEQYQVYSTDLPYKHTGISDYSRYGIPTSTVFSGLLDNTVGHSIPDSINHTSDCIELVNHDNECDFFTGRITRLTYSSSSDVPLTGVLPTGYNATGLTYVCDYSAVDDNGVVTIPPQGAYVVNIDRSHSNTLVLDKGLSTLEVLDYGNMYQDDDHTPIYEVIETVGGYQLRNNPVTGTLVVYDYINVDAYGNARVLPQENYTVDTFINEDMSVTTTVALTGINPYNNKHVDHSNYFVEYQYRNYLYPKCITSSDRVWHTDRFNGLLFTSAPVNYYGTIVEHSSALTPSTTHKLLRFSPLDVRPGTAVDIVFTYTATKDIEWDGASMFVYDVSNEPDYYSVDASGVYVYAADVNITSRFSPIVNGSTVSIAAAVSEYKPPYTVSIRYMCRKLYSNIGTVPSFSSVAGATDPYPYDYMIDNGYLVPYTVAALTDTNDKVKAALLNSGDDQFKVVSYLEFGGIAYSKSQGIYYILENNNLCMYRVTPGGAIVSKHNIFKLPNLYMPGRKKSVTAHVDYNGNTEVYPLISHELDVSGRRLGPCVMHNDTLLIVSYAGTGDDLVDGSRLGGDGIYIIDVYNDRVLDICYSASGEYPDHFPLPIINGSRRVGTAVVDMALDDSGNILVLEDNTIKTIVPRYDHTFIDNSENKATVYYREYYPSGVIMVEC